MTALKHLTVFPTKHSVEETMFKQNWRQNPKSGNVVLTSSSREKPWGRGERGVFYWQVQVQTYSKLR